MKFALILVAILFTSTTFSQKPQQWSSSEIYGQIKKLNVLGKVLYLAAHPDDENTRFIAYCANEKRMETAYMSLTRGDGGQNLIGPELREELGLIRTQELLMARRVDGGKQFFSRANDFGYSKNPDETFAIWNKDLVLGDLVYVIRSFQPDVIVCRFPSDGRGGHGHHTASALLGEEAFSMAADPNAYPEQLNEVKVWQAKRIVTNTGRWWNNSISAEDPNVVSEDIGAYSALLGTSCNEIAAESRTMHKSQGFGSTGVRGESLEYFEHVQGEKANKSLFDGVESDWNRVNGAKGIQKMIETLLKNFDLNHPEKSITGLIALSKRLDKLENSVWKTTKKKEVNQLIIQCAGLFLQATTNDLSASSLDSVDIRIEATARTTGGFVLKRIASKELAFGYDLDSVLRKNEPLIWSKKELIYNGFPVSSPYWLSKKGTLGTYAIPRQSIVLQPESSPAVNLELSLTIQGYEITVVSPLVFKSNDPVKGELVQPFYVTPKISIRPEQNQMLIKNKEKQLFKVYVKALSNDFKGDFSLELPRGWKIGNKPESIILTRKGEEKSYEFELIPEKEAESGEIKVSVKTNDLQVFNQTIHFIQYDHIPTQILSNASTIQLTLLDLKKEGRLIGYLEGAGDDVPAALKLMGYSVEMVDEKNLGQLAKMDAIVIGIRALNTNDRIDFIMPALLKYVEEGGNLIVQYNTSHSVKTDNFSPYTLKLSRDRVTDETAEVTILDAEHPALNFPNLITQEDFTNWVQERGLYFPGEWANEFTPLLAMNDPGETSKKGALLIAQYGKGFYVYTGISFFRQLPAGVPGAYRLLANLLSLGHE